jgi:hypothetical protein
MPDSFSAATTLTRLSDHEHTFLVPDHWQQGRGAFGGLVLGAMMNAMIAAERDAERLPRALTGDLCGPALPKEARIVTRVLRRGKNQTNVSAVLEQDGAVVAHATSVLATARKVAPASRIALDPPPRIPYEAAVAGTFGAAFGPPFAEHYEYRITGPMPFTGGSEPLVLGWVKERVPLTRLTAAALLGRVDSYYPSFFSVETSFRPMATVSFLAEFLCDPASLDPLAPLFYRARSVAQAGGYLVEMRELWNGDVPVLLNQQSFALLG